MLRRIAAPLAVVLALAPRAPAADWKTYRSERFGYEISYPPEMELKAYFDGVSSDLRTAAGETVLQLAVWPGDTCPREAPGTTAKALGLERAATVTQADGDDTSSSCEKPVSIRESVSAHGVRLWELHLACHHEHPEGRRTVRERVGTKGPTFFADVSQPWRTRVLALDPEGNDPRFGTVRLAVDEKLVREIVATVATFPLPDPHDVCIGDLGRPAAGVVATPGR
jgi:hypothetical protein